MAIIGYLNPREYKSESTFEGPPPTHWKLSIIGSNLPRCGKVLILYVVSTHHIPSPIIPLGIKFHSTKDERAPHLLLFL